MDNIQHSSVISSWITKEGKYSRYFDAISRENLTLHHNVTTFLLCKLPLQLLISRLHHLNVSCNNSTNKIWYYKES